MCSVPQEELIQHSAKSPFVSIYETKNIVNIINDYNLNDVNVQKLIHSTDLHFDVVINEEFWLDSFLMFAHKFKAPIITICLYLTRIRISLTQFTQSFN